MRRRCLLIAALVACVAIAGCGASNREADAADVAESFYAALEASDGEAACEHLAPETASKLEQQEQKPCEEAILELELPPGGTPAQTSVYVTTATVSRAEGGRAFLDEYDNGWKVSAAGCEPTAPELPYDCELEG